MSDPKQSGKDKKLVDTFGESFLARLGGKKVVDEVPSSSLAVGVANLTVLLVSAGAGFLTGKLIRSKQPKFPSLRNAFTTIRKDIPKVKVTKE